MTEEESSYRKMVYKQARLALRKPRGSSEILYALKLLDTVNGNKALGFKLRLQRKAAGEPYGWRDF
mgnify:CR=1 FL=1